MEAFYHQHVGFSANCSNNPMTRPHFFLLMLAIWPCAPVVADIVEKRDNEPYLPKHSVFSGTSQKGEFFASDNRPDVNSSATGNCLVANSRIERLSISELNFDRPVSNSPFKLVNSKPDFTCLELIKEVNGNKLEGRSKLSIQIIEELARDMESIDEIGSDVYHKQSHGAAAKDADERLIMEAPMFSETGLSLVLMLVAFVLPVTYFQQTQRVLVKFAILCGCRCRLTDKRLVYDLAFTWVAGSVRRARLQSHRAKERPWHANCSAVALPSHPAGSVQ